MRLEKKNGQFDLQSTITHDAFVYTFPPSQAYLDREQNSELSPSTHVVCYEKTRKSSKP